MKYEFVTANSFFYLTTNNLSQKNTKIKLLIQNVSKIQKTLKMLTIFKKNDILLVVIIMFTSITLKNYKSLFDFTADFTRGKNKAKNMILIYGENGIGKTCLVDAFYTLHQLLFTRSIREKINKYNNQDMSIYSQNRLFDPTEIIDIIEENKSIGSEENMFLSFEFLIGDQKGIYTVEMDDQSLVYEKLDFAINKNIVNIFEITSNNKRINSSAFNNDEFYQYINDSVDKYWGKHSLLSIFNYEIEDKNFEYIKNQLSKSLMTVMKFFNTMSIRVKKGNWAEVGLIGVPSKLLKNLEKGVINARDEKRLVETEKILSKYFSLLNKDVKKAYYEKIYDNNLIRYQLWFEKEIYDKLINIEFKLESTGTQNLLYLLPFFISSLEGNIIVIDEFDTGIHDLLTEKLILELFETIGFKGQSIITTHNTRLMESEISKDLMYIMKYEDRKKVLKPLNEIVKIQKNNNVRRIYCSGDLGGIPDVDLSGMSNILENINNEN